MQRIIRVSFQSLYIYEYKKKTEGYSERKELINSFYFSGLYPGKEGNEKLWGNVNDYISKTYDTEKLKRVFISGDGAPWIKNGTDHIYKALFCADKFHLMKYINLTAAQMLDEKIIKCQAQMHKTAYLY